MTTTPDYQFHPIANIFPLIEGAEFQALIDDIHLNGLHEPIVKYEGRILDGRNRYRAAVEAKYDLEDKHFIEYADGDPVGYVVSLNLRRRHLDESQRSVVAAKIVTMKRGSNQHSPIGETSQAKAAELLNVGKRTVERAQQVINKGTPELVRAVETGQASVSAAAEVATLPKEQQTEIVAKGRDEIIKEANRIKREEKQQKQQERVATITALAATVAPASARYTLYNEPCINAIDRASTNNDTFDWVITDPPYPREFLPVYGDLARIAAQCLKPGGSLLCMIGQSYLPDIVAMLSDKLTYHWTIAYLTPGGQATQLFPRKVNTFWKPILWFTNGAYEGGWIGDATRSAANDNDKTRHHWGQSESGMHDLMRRFVKPGDRVLDPFMGAGTTGAVALDLGAHFTGYDINQTFYNETLARFANDRLDAAA